MKRREFSKNIFALGLGTQLGLTSISKAFQRNPETSNEFYIEEAKRLPKRYFDVVVSGAGTAGVVAALAAARNGAKTVLIESKGYPGGTVVEGGTALHSFYNLWKAFPGVKKKMVVKGIPQDIINRLLKVGATTGYAEMETGFDYDSVCTAIDTELYKLTIFEMLNEAGVFVCVNTLLAGAVKNNNKLEGVIVESRSGREAFYAKAFVDCTAYGDLSYFAGADYSIPNDYDVCNSFGLGNVNIEKVYTFLQRNNALSQEAKGRRSGKDDMIVRIQAETVKLPKEFHEQASKLGLSMTTTTVYDNYFMFIKVNYKLPGIPTSRDDIAKAELEIRQRQYKSLQLMKKFIPGCENSYITRTSPSLNIRRGRLITCDYDITHEDVIEAKHFNDEVYVYGFHDSAPRYQVKNGGTYGVPYRALCVKGIDNLYVSGMMITSDQRAHMSTRNTVSCMAQGQATGTAAALCSAKNIMSRELKYEHLRSALIKNNVYFET